MLESDARPQADPLCDWWRTAVVYQIYPRSFADADGDGIGDLQGIIGKLDYLRELGVDVLWLSPIYTSPQDDNGYDISDYQNIDALFGSLETFDELVRGAHARGMKLVMDLVVNHTSDEHAWFVESRSSRDNPKRDWYWWRDAKSGHEPGSDGAEPNNWASFFSGSTWQYDERSQHYYLHLFSKKQPDLNWENPALRQAIYAMMRWWLDRGVDGFRMDVINLLSKDTALPDGVVATGKRYGNGFPYFVGGPRSHEFLREMYAEVFAGRPGHVLTVGETPSVTIEEALKFTDPARQELDMVFQFEHVGLDHGVTKWDRKPLDLRQLKASLARWQLGLGAVGWNSLYWNNHDQPRAVSRFGDDGVHRVASAKTLATVLHLQRGTPYIYQGEELGMTNALLSAISDYRDIESLNHYAESVAAGADVEQLLLAMAAISRDNARTPMQWDASRNAGFTTGTPWLAVNPNHVEINAAAAVQDPNSVFHHYRRLIELRHAEAVVALGDFTPLLPDDPSVYAFRRRLAEVELLVIANFSRDEVRAGVDDADAWSATELLLCNLDEPSKGRTLLLRPWESRVYRRTVS